MLKTTAKYLLESASAFQPRHWRASQMARSQAAARPLPAGPGVENLEMVVSWLKRAQDSTGGGGVSWGYCARTPTRTGKIYGWRPPYPETTGYIIETMLRYADLAGDSDARLRARRMADWELAMQLPDGGLPGGFYTGTPTPGSTFVTGQVIFGLVRAFEVFGDPAYLQAACRAGNFLLRCLDAEGRFVTGYSEYCSAGPKAYESRTGWALAELGRVSGEAQYSDAAARVAGFALRCRQRNGWFAQNDLDDHTRPLTHTIGYVLEGLLETSRVLSQPALRDPVVSTLTSMAPLVEPDGYLAGRWTSEWEPAASSCCLTGSCQLACVYFRAHSLDPSLGFADTGLQLLRFVTGTQRKSGGPPGLIGGIQGSYPFDGEYGPFSLLNWSAKFYADAVMDYRALSHHGSRQGQTTLAALR